MGKILFIRGGAVGDFILTMPAMKLVRDQLPDNEITVLGYPSICELARATGIVDEVRSIEDAQLAHFFNPKGKLDPKWCEFFAQFNVVVSYLYDPDGYFSGNLERAGVKTLLKGPFKPVEDVPEVPAAIQLAKPLEQLALFLDRPSLALDFDSSLCPDDLKSISGTKIALHPGSGSPQKNWSLSSWASLLETIHQKDSNTHFFITSGEAEASSIQIFLRQLQDRRLPFTHLSNRSLIEMGMILNEMDFFLGHDSGMSHLAALCDLPGMLLFGPTNPKIWAPVSSTIEVVSSPTQSMSDLLVEKVSQELERSSLFTA